MQKFLLSAILFFLVLITFALFFFFYETQYFGSRASMTIVDISAENSYVFTNPLKAQANGKDKIRVTIFVLNGQGLGVPSKKVIVGADPRLVVSNVQDTTDTTGKAIFEYSTTVPGEYYLDVGIDEIKLPQKARLSFYQ
ncbi:MAG: Ig-like domain-containing protein [Candidatus Roizmanbacteria bacterium]|nr:Ig-like domain-containing protein [Candidatus Roizmanbacteria bacterium]